MPRTHSVRVRLKRRLVNGVVFMIPVSKIQRTEVDRANQEMLSPSITRYGLLTLLTVQVNFITSITVSCIVPLEPST